MANLEKRVQQLELRLGAQRRRGRASSITQLSGDELWEIALPGIEPAIWEQMLLDHPRLVDAMVLRPAVSAFRAQRGGQALTAEQRAAIQEAVTHEDGYVRGDGFVKYVASALQAQADGHELTADQRACIEEIEAIIEQIDRICKEHRKHKASSIPKVGPFVSIP